MVWHQNTGYTCRICDKTFPHPSKLAAHEKTASHQLLSTFLVSAQSNPDHTTHDVVEGDEVHVYKHVLVHVFMINVFTCAGI